MLSKEYLNSLFNYNPETGLLTWKIARSNRILKGSVVGSDTGNGYFKVSIDKKYYKVHRIVWQMLYGNLPDNYVIDHINGDGQDNRLCNLRLATLQENQRNSVKSKPSTSKYKGVNYDKERGKWKAEFRYNNKSYFIGRFNTEEDAKEAYDAVAKVAFGEFFNKG